MMDFVVLESRNLDNRPEHGEHEPERAAPNEHGLDNVLEPECEQQKPVVIEEEPEAPPSMCRNNHLPESPEPHISENQNRRVFKRSTMRWDLVAAALGIVILLICTFLSKTLIVEWRTVTAALIAKPPLVFEFGDAARTEKVHQIVSALFRGQGIEAHLSLLPPFVYSDVNDTDWPEQLRLLADYSPPDSDILLPMWTREPISEAYGLFLSDYFLVEQARLQLDQKSIDRLETLVTSRKKVQSVNELQLAIPANKGIAALALRYLHLSVADESRLMAIVNAYSTYEIENATEIDRSKLPTFAQEWDHGTQLDTAETFDGPGAFLISSQPNGTALDLSVHITGGDYRLIPLVPPPYLDLAVLRQGKSANIAKPRLNSYFGPRGYLTRIPIALVAYKLQSASVMLPPNDCEKLQKLAAPESRASLSAGGAKFALDPAQFHVLASSCVLQVESSEPVTQIVAVVSEVM